MFRAIEAFRLFDLVYILTSGVPGSRPRRCRSTSTRSRSSASTPGVASAYGILMVVVVIVLAQLYLRYLNKLKEGMMAISSRRGRARRRPATDQAPPRRRRGGRGRARWSRSRCSTVLAVVMLFPVLWMLETSHQGEPRRLRRAREVLRLRHHPGPLQGRVRRAAAAAASDLSAVVPQLGRSWRARRPCSPPCWESPRRGPTRASP